MQKFVLCGGGDGGGGSDAFLSFLKGSMIYTR